MKKSLDRFLIAQQNYYHDAYEELKVGKKRRAISLIRKLIALNYHRRILFTEIFSYTLLGGSLCLCKNENVLLYVD